MARIHINTIDHILFYMCHHNYFRQNYDHLFHHLQSAQKTDEFHDFNGSNFNSNHRINHDNYDHWILDHVWVHFRHVWVQGLSSLLRLNGFPQRPINCKWLSHGGISPILRAISSLSSSFSGNPDDWTDLDSKWIVRDYGHVLLVCCWSIWFM